MMNAFWRSEIGRGVTVALITVGITLLTISPLFLLQFLHTL